MDNLYITNYCDKRCSPLKSITRLSKHEAYKVAKELSQHACTRFTSFSRFTDKDFDGYYKKRKRTEEWLYSKIMDLGVKPKNITPLYFVLGEGTYLNSWFEEGIKTKLLLKDIDFEDISFTFGDSMSKMDSVDRMNPFNKDTLFEFIVNRTNDINSFLAELDEQNRYIEVQLWNDMYLKNRV